MTPRINLSKRLCPQTNEEELNCFTNKKGNLLANSKPSLSHDKSVSFSPLPTKVEAGISIRAEQYRYIILTCYGTDILTIHRTLPIINIKDDMRPNWLHIITYFSFSPPNAEYQLCGHQCKGKDRPTPALRIIKLLSDIIVVFIRHRHEQAKDGRQVSSIVDKFRNQKVLTHDMRRGNKQT